MNDRIEKLCEFTTEAPKNSNILEKKKFGSTVIDLLSAQYCEITR